MFVFWGDFSRLTAPQVKENGGLNAGGQMSLSCLYDELNVGGQTSLFYLQFTKVPT